MSSNNMYNILGKLNALTPKEETPKQAAQKIYESVEAHGSITAGVKSIEAKLAAKLAEAKKSKPDFLDMDKDGNKKEPMKKAIADKKKNPFAKKVDESEMNEVAAPGQEGWIKKNKQHFIDQYGKEKGMSVLYATAWKRHHAANESVNEGEECDVCHKEPCECEVTESNVYRHKGTYGTEYQGDGDEEEAQANQPKKRGRPAKGTAPKKKNAPGVKGRPKKAAEPFTGKGTADAVKSLSNVFGMGQPPKGGKKGTVHKMVGESRIHEASEYTYEKVAQTLAKEKPGMDVNSNEFFNAVYDELIAIGMTPRAARYNLNYDEDFLGDVATEYNHCCKAVDEGRDILDNPDAPTYLRQKIAKERGIDDYKMDLDTVHDKSHNISSPEGLAKLKGELGMSEEVTLEAELNELAKLAGLQVEESVVAECGMMGPTEQEDNLNINTSQSSNGDKNVTVSATGEQAEALLQMLKMAGLGGGEGAERAQHAIVVAQEAKDYGDTDVEEAPEYANTPDPEVEDVDTILDQGNDLNRKKKQFADKPKAGDNPMASESVSPLDTLGRKLMKAYESIKLAK